MKTLHTTESRWYARSRTLLCLCPLSHRLKLCYLVRNSCIVLQYYRQVPVRVWLFQCTVQSFLYIFYFLSFVCKPSQAELCILCSSEWALGFKWCSNLISKYICRMVTNTFSAWMDMSFEEESYRKKQHIYPSRQWRICFPPTRYVQHSSTAKGLR